MPDSPGVCKTKRSSAHQQLLPACPIDDIRIVIVVSRSLGIGALLLKAPRTKCQRRKRPSDEESGYKEVSVMQTTVCASLTYPGSYAESPGGHLYYIASQDEFTDWELPSSRSSTEESATFQVPRCLQREDFGNVGRNSSSSVPGAYSSMLEAGPKVMGNLPDIKSALPDSRARLQWTRFYCMN